MTRRPLLSVVVHNVAGYARFLPRFFRALEAQTMDPAAMEVVMVDEGSSIPADVVQGWSRRLGVADLRAVGVHGGGLPGVARNVGMAQARGRFLVCPDPRDVMAPTFLSRCLAALEIDPGAALALAGWCRLGGRDALCLAEPSADTGLLARRNDWPPVVLMRREVWEAGRGFADNTAYVEWDFWIQAALNGFRAVPAPGVLYERREGGADPRTPERDGLSKAAVVLNNRAFFHPEVAAWARAVRHGLPWADPMARGLIPAAGDVRSMRGRTERAGVRGGIVQPLDATLCSVSSAHS